MGKREEFHAPARAMRPEDFAIGRLFERVPDAVVVSEAESRRIVLWNPAAEATFGYGAAEILGRELSVIVPEGIPAERRALGLVVVPARRKDGRRLVIELSSSPITSAEVAGAFELAIARDVTDRVEAERALRERAELLDVSHDAIVMLDPDLRITYWNKGAEAVYGWSAGEALGRVVSELLKTRFPTSRQALIDELLARGRWEGELTHTRRGGQDIVVSSRWVLRRDASGRPVAIMDTNNDITARKRTQDELRRQAEALAQANEELRAADRYKDEFLAVVSHELRTPLNFIISFASVLDEEIAGPLNAREHEFVAKVLEGADRLLMMVDNLLEMSRLAAGKFELSRSWTPVAALAEQVLAGFAPLAAAKGIALSSRIDAPEEYWLDGERLKRLLVALVDNAIKFTPAGGRVLATVRAEGDRLVVEVEDTGIGIEEADLPGLFTRLKQLDMSATREAGGMGIGLALSKAIAEGHGGRLGVESRPGAGSTFRAELPLSRPGSA